MLSLSGRFYTSYSARDSPISKGHAAPNITSAQTDDPCSPPKLCLTHFVIS